MLENWLKLVHPEAIVPEGLADYQAGRQLAFYHPQATELPPTQIAIVGMEEAEANAVRRALYRMSFPFAGLACTDFGNLYKPDPAFAIPLFKELLDSQIIPVLIGSSGQQLLAPYKAFQRLQSHVSLSVVDERIRLSEQHPDDPNQYLNDIVLSTRSRLYHLGMIGCQTHYTDPAAFSYLEKNNFDCLRLGSARTDLSEAEPLIRDGDLAGFHLNAIRQADAPAQLEATPTGFTAEEACQLSRYAGMSDKLRAFAILGWQSARDRDAQTAQLVAQMVWYFIEGVYNRKRDFPVSTDGLVEYIVEIKHLEDQLTFWKSRRSSRWWMQVPVKTSKKYTRHRLIPCSYNDYQRACQGEPPDRLLNAYKRFL